MPLEFEERTTLDIQKSKATPDIILRLTDVLKRTGLSRSTLYNRIARNEFPHQVSLGGRAVGWLNGEVENWINGRKLLRSGSAAGTSERALHDEEGIIESTRVEKRERPRSTEKASSMTFGNSSSPDPKKLHMVSAKLYFDKSSGSFWLKLCPEI